MADLDDFFAKKDRKKSKTSSKKFAATPDELVKQIEDNTAKKLLESRPVARQENAAGVSVRPATAAAVAAAAAAAAASAEGAENGADAVEQTVVVEDEWKEFEVEERKDYSGLKIGQLQIADENDEAADEAANEKYDNDGELNADGERQRGGPWNKGEDGDASEVVASALPAAVTAPAGDRAYVSPAMRTAQAMRAKLRKGVLPDIHDQEYFPVLGSAKPEEVKKKRPEPGFEEVRHGGRFQRPSEIASSAPVSIGNRFNSLADS